MSENEASLKAAPLFELMLETGGAHAISAAPFGDRTVIDIRGGAFKGPRVSGIVLPSGGDWIARAEGGARLDVRMLLQSQPDDESGSLILFHYTGVATQGENGARACVSGRFEAPRGANAWLNFVHAVGYGSGGGGTARYSFFQLL